VVAFSLRPNDGSQYRRKIEEGCDEFYQIPEGINAAELAKFINKANIHILFNLNGWTQGARNDVFCLRPAPLQVSFMGFCSSMGADYIDYIITDKIASPPEVIDRLYTEKGIFMPHSYFANDYKQSCRYVFDSDRPTRKQYGLPEDKFIFANFNQMYKIDPKTFSIWMNILKRVPDSVLWLLEYPADARPNLQKEAQSRGVDPSRIIITPKAPKNEHINRCYLADLSLDNLITNGHTTSCDLLWSGCPLLTFPATENMPSRVAASICTALGCPEMVANTFHEYESLAVMYATHKYKL
jgi:protein O-GlcNAc transferase